MSTEDQLEADKQAIWDELDEGDIAPAGQTLAETLTTDAPTGLEMDSDEPAPGRVEPEQRKVEAKPEPVKADPIAELNASIAALARDLRNEVRAVNGRVGGLTDQFKQVKAEAAVAKAANIPQGPSEADIKAAEKNPAEWEALGADFPEWKTAIEKFVASKTAAVAKTAAPAIDVEALITQKIDPLISQRVNSVLDEREQRKAQESAARAHISEAIPDWLDVVKTPEFKAWRDQQPPGIQALGASDDPRDAVSMLRMFRPESAKTQTQVQSERDARLRKAVAPGKSVAQGPRTAIAVDDMTPDQLWAYMDRQDAAKEARH